VNTERTVRILIADDHTILRESVSEALQMVEGFEVVAQAKDGAEAVALAGKTNPDVLLLDIEMPVMGAREAMSRLGETSPSCKVIILTMFDNPDLVRELFARGASAYLAKTVSQQELVSTVRSVAAGEDRVILSISREALGKLDGSATHVLSERQLEILLLVARGNSNAQIASVLYLTEGTIKRHLHNIYAKVDVASRGEAVRKALEEGWITARDITEVGTG